LTGLLQREPLFSSAKSKHNRIMNYQDLYRDTIEKLKRGERPLIKLDQELIQHLREVWSQSIQETVDEDSLKKILCILDNTQNMSREFNEHFFVTLEILRVHTRYDDLLIYTLAASQKHVIGEALKSGVMIPGVYFDHLKKNLETKNPEVLEWTLRTIESLGPMSLRLQKEVRTLKPSLLKLFNEHQKAAFSIVDFLEKEWERMKL